MRLSRSGTTGRSRRARRGWRHPGLILLVALLVAGCRDAESSVARGDRLWADSNYTAALAEYRLSQAIRSDSEEILARVAHAYAVTGQFERAQESYDELLRMAPGYTDQAVFDYLALARRAQARNDRYGMAGALEAAIALRPGLPVDDMAAPLARFYSRANDAERAVEFFERALAYAPPDSAGPLLFDYAQFQASQGNCEDAVELFNAFRTRQPRGERADQARWAVGNCSFSLGRQARASGQADDAVRYLDAMLALGVPQNLLDQAWFERGEALLELGRRDEALESFVRSLEHVRALGGPLAERARQRIDEIRFGREVVP